jgi:hypothetical protein
MAEFVFGEIDWNSGATPAGAGGRASDFMRLSEGENVVRVMGNPTQYFVHWVTTADGSTKKINSPIDDSDLVRRLEDEGYRRQARWIVKVLDRTDDTFKLLEIGSQIYNGIRSLFNHPKWGKVTQYDLSVNRGPKGSQPLYNVTPNPKESLDASLKDSYVEFNDRVNLEKLISPADPQDVLTLMGWTSDAQTVTSAAGEETAEKTVSDDFEFSFDE